MLGSRLLLRGLNGWELEQAVRRYSHNGLNEHLHFIGLTFSKQCNYRCIYCAQDAGEPAAEELTTEQQIEIVTDAAALGAQVVLIAGAGEPTLDPAFKAVVQAAYSMGMVTVLYTNGSALTPALSKFLFEHDVSVCLKLDTINGATFSQLVGRQKALQRTLKGLQHLQEAGYAQWQQQTEEHTITRLAANAVVTRLNLQQLRDLALFCEQQGLKLFLDNLSVIGRAETHWQDLMVSQEEYVAMCTTINTLLGREEVGHSLNREESCMLWKHGIVIYLDGEARVCYDEAVPERIGTIYEYSLKTLTARKQDLYPPLSGAYDCPLKQHFRDQLLQKVGTTLSPEQVLTCFGEANGCIHASQPLNIRA